jgi:two-component system, sensor histidine kinase PdtaS
MQSTLTPSGIPAVGPVSWGSHFCQLYENSSDLADGLVPYFKAGLERNELCHWVTTHEFGVERAKSALSAAYPKLDEALASGQIIILDRNDWYTPSESFDPDAVVGGWLGHEERARSLGYSGYRLTGDTLWLEPHQWDEFSKYEELVNQAFATRRMVALCTYCMGRCGASEVLDLVNTHAFAVARRRGSWEVVESPSLKLAKSELAELNATLEARVAEATEELRRLVGQKEALLKEVHHRVKNNLQIVANLIAMRSSHAPDQAREVLLETAERVQAISAVHEALYDQANDGGVEIVDRVRSIGQRLLDTYGASGRVALTVVGDDLRLPLNAGVPLALLATELLSNALKHAFPGDRRGTVQVRVAHLEDGGFSLSVIDDGTGTPATTKSRRGSGLHIAQALARQLGGKLDVQNLDDGGVAATLVAARPRD